MNNFYLNSIRHSQKGYISDPWVFLRELAQNSRDSGALEIKIDPGGHGSDNEVIIFSDNGQGMTYKDAEKYLFRLYSSSKFNERSSVGMYGVGFWTVMKYEPDEILIESYSVEEEKWAVVLGGDLKNRKTECHLSKFGTRITLVRKKKYADFDNFCRDMAHIYLAVDQVSGCAGDALIDSHRDIVFQPKSEWFVIQRRDDFSLFSIHKCGKGPCIEILFLAGNVKQKVVDLPELPFGLGIKGDHGHFPRTGMVIIRHQGIVLAIHGKVTMNQAYFFRVLRDHLAQEKMHFLALEAHVVAELGDGDLGMVRADPWVTFCGFTSLQVLDFCRQ